MTAAVARRVEAPRRRTSQDRSSRTPSQAVRRPQLRAVPRPSTAANAMFALVGMIGVLMLAAVVLHTRLADRQLEIDRLQAEVSSAQERFDVLRQQRAELSSPNRIALEAQNRGMLSSTESNFLELDAASYAEVVVAVGAGSATAAFTPDDAPLDQLRRVREAAND
jgi:cell division protein FtsL